jgi:hypothetical protein
MQGYDTFLADFCRSAPDRLTGNAILPETGIDDGLAELARCKKLGLPSISPAAPGPTAPATRSRKVLGCLAGYRHEDPATSELRRSDRAGWQRQNHQMDGVRGGRYRLSRTGGNHDWSIDSDVFDKFSTLNFYFAETNGGWLAHYFNWLKEYYLRSLNYLDIRKNKRLKAVRDDPEVRCQLLESVSNTLRESGCSRQVRNQFEFAINRGLIALTWPEIQCVEINIH